MTVKILTGLCSPLLKDQLISQNLTASDEAIEGWQRDLNMIEALRMKGRLSMKEADSAVRRTIRGIKANVRFKN